MRKTILIVLVIIGAFVAWKLTLNQLGADSGEDAPEITGTLPDGADFQLSDLRGKYVIVDFWGSWCRPCRVENPHLVKFYEQYAGKEFKDAEGLEIVSIALEKSPQNWAAAREKDGLYWPNHIVEETPAVLMSPLARAYGVSDIPAKFLIDPEGKLLDANNFNEMGAILDAQLR